MGLVDPAHATFADEPGDHDAAKVKSQQRVHATGPDTRPGREAVVVVDAWKRKVDDATRGMSSLRRRGNLTGDIARIIGCVFRGFVGRWV
jgi:hypothetical protein